MTQSVQEYLGVPPTWPVKENVKHEIVLMPNKTDIRRGKPGNPKACALHNAACRVFNVPNAAIGGKIAYIPQRDTTGKPYIARVRATPDTQKAIRTFDKTGKLPESGFRFSPVPKHESAVVKRVYMRNYSRDISAGLHVPTPQQATKRRKVARVRTRGIPTNVKLTY